MSGQTVPNASIWRLLILVGLVLLTSALGTGAGQAQEAAPPPIFPPAPPATAPTGPAASAPARSVEPGEDEVVRGDPSRPRVSLVINVGAGSEPAVSMLDTLREKNYRTTFFVLGWWADKRPDILKRIADDGHEVASHGHSVFDLTSVSDAAVREDLLRADASISAVTGKTTRPLWSASAGYRNARVHRIAAELGYRPIYLTVDSLDWTREATADSVYTRVMERIVNGAIVVLHFDSPTTVTSTAGALPRLIDDLRAAGYSLVTITELLTE
ncbi:MAG: polysaccharide deacetylase family protein [Chloroflexi bacterium]|nr:polysaccharide deacetylase family protein [Chloroflexota bacterium]